MWEEFSVIFLVKMMLLFFGLFFDLQLKKYRNYIDICITFHFSDITFEVCIEMGSIPFIK